MITHNTHKINDEQDQPNIKYRRSYHNIIDYFIYALGPPKLLSVLSLI